MIDIKLGFAWQILAGTVVAFGIMMSGRDNNNKKDIHGV
jgi:hypothetical protein